MEFREAMIEWARQKRRRDRRDPFERDRTVTALRTLYAGIKESSSPIDPSLSEGLVIGHSGMYDLETASDDQVLQWAEDLYQQGKQHPEGKS